METGLLLIHEWSVDAAIGWDVAGVGWGLGALGVALVGGSAVLALGRRLAALDSIPVTAAA